MMIIVTSIEIIVIIIPVKRKATRKETVGKNYGAQHGHQAPAPPNPSR